MFELAGVVSEVFRLSLRHFAFSMTLDFYSAPPILAVPLLRLVLEKYRSFHPLCNCSSFAFRRILENLGAIIDRKMTPALNRDIPFDFF